MNGYSGTVDRFEDRTEAGRRLGEALAERDLDADVVLAIPRGGLPLGRAVADALDLPLDIAVASKIGAPGNPELAIGAVASDGSAWLDEEAIAAMGVDEAYVSRERQREAEAAREKAERYRTDGPVDVPAGPRSSSTTARRRGRRPSPRCGSSVRAAPTVSSSRSRSRRRRRSTSWRQWPTRWSVCSPPPRSGRSGGSTAGSTR